MAGEAFDLHYWRAVLEARVRELSEEAGHANPAMQTVELDQTRVGRVSRVDALQAQAMAQEAGRRRRQALARMRRALEKLEAGDFGYCETCDAAIAHARLDIDPAVTHCITCAERLE